VPGFAHPGNNGSANTFIGEPAHRGAQR
jgi:hypothetical protein